MFFSVSQPVFYTMSLSKHLSLFQSLLFLSKPSSVSLFFPVSQPLIRYYPNLCPYFDCVSSVTAQAFVFVWASASLGVLYCNSASGPASVYIPAFVLVQAFVCILVSVLVEAFVCVLASLSNLYCNSASVPASVHTPASVLVQGIVCVLASLSVLY